MGTTTNYAIPYPAGSDPPAGAPQMQSLAERVDAVLKTNANADTALTTRVTNVETGAAAGPKGYITQTVSNASVSGIGTTVTDIGVSATFTAVANRAYRVTFGAALNGTTVSQFVALLLATSTNVARKNAIATLSANPTYGHSTTNMVVFSKKGVSLAAGSTTLKLRLNTAAGTCGTDAANDPTFILVEDIGADP